MQVIVKDQVTAVLDAIGAKRGQYKPVTEAVGLQLVGLTIRSFNDESVRASPWAALKESTIASKIKEGDVSTAILKRRSLLWRSWHVVEATDTHVKVGSDRKTKKDGLSLAAIHQWGTRDGRIPARPMLPMTGSQSSPRFTDLAVKRLVSVAKAELARLLLSKTRSS